MESKKSDKTTNVTTNTKRITEKKKINIGK